MNNRELGNRGEQLALEYLLAQGCLLLAKNFRCRIGEIDLIVQDGQTIVFVEVKSRSGKGWGLPQEAVDFRKQSKIQKIAQYFLLTQRMAERDLRFDVIAVEFNNSPPKILQIKGAF